MIGIWLTLDFRWVLMIHHLFKICTYANIMQISHPWHGFHIILHCDISFQHVLRALPSKWTRKTHWLQWSALGCSGESSSTERASRPPKNHIRLPGQMRMNQKSRHPAIWSIYLFLHDIYIQLKNGKIDIDIAIIFGSQSNISIFYVSNLYTTYTIISLYIVLTARIRWWYVKSPWLSPIRLVKYGQMQEADHVTPSEGQ